MLRRFGNRAGFILLVLSCGFAAGCGTSGSRPAAPAEDAPIETVTDEPSIPSDPSTDPSPALPPAEVPESVTASYQRALDAMRRADWVEAELELEALLLESASFPGPYLNLAIVYRQDGRMDEAIDALEQALAVSTDHPVALSELGVIYRERGEFEEAEAAYRRAIEADPSYALAHYNLGVLLDVYLQRQADALTHYEAYLSLSSESDQEVELWIVDIRRRLGMPPATEQVAQEN